MRMHWIFMKKNNLKTKNLIFIIEKLDSKIEFWCIYMGGIPRGGYRNSLGTPGGTPHRPSQNPPTLNSAVDPCMSILGHNSGQSRTART